MTEVSDRINQVRDIIYAPGLTSMERAKRIEALYVSASPAVPGGWLFIAMDDDQRATLTFCKDEAEIRTAVKGAMFCGDDLLPEHEEEIDGLTARLLEDGFVNFEADPPLHLFKLAAAPPPPSEDGK